MGEFSDKVFEVVARVPAGQVTTYGGVARAMGRPQSGRYVGFALRHAPGPDVLACHRVVFGDGRLANAYVFGGPDVQRARLEAEGVPFLPDGRVDLARCEWRPDADALGRPTDIDWAAEGA